MQKHQTLIIVGLLLLSACNSGSSSEEPSWYSVDVGEGYEEYEDKMDDEYENTDVGVHSNCFAIPFTETASGILTIPVTINGMCLDMIFDTGASSTFITLAEANYLFEKGRLSEDDIIDIAQFQTADGNITVGVTINLREVVLGDQIRLTNVEAVVVENQQAPLLLGQSVMKHFAETSVDRTNSTIKFYTR